MSITPEEFQELMAMIDEQERERQASSCPTCEGRGYLLDQTYGGEIAEGWTPVQRCDACSRYLGDDDAAAAAARDHGASTVAFFDPIDTDLPGDFAIRLPAST